MDAVRVRAGGSDFFLLADADEQDVDRLAADISGLAGNGGTLRLRPRTAPDDAEWVRSGTDLGESDHELTGDEDPGTSWRDILGSDVVEVVVVQLDQPTALWHWAIETPDGHRVG